MSAVPRGPAQGGAVAFPELAPAQLEGEPWSDRIWTGIGTALDAAVLLAMQRVVDALLSPAPEDLPALRASGARLADPALQRAPERFFAFEDGAPRVLRARGRMRRALDGGVVLARELVVRCRPFGLEDGAERAEREETIHVEHWQRREARPLGAVVALHGFSMGRPRLDALALFAGEWFRRGLDVVLVTLPYHGVRTPADARFSGEHFASPHVARFGEAVRQAVYEVRAVARWLRETREAPVGVLGLSLGGYLAALCAGLEPELAFAVPIAPPVCVGDLAWRFLSRGPAGTAAFTREEMRGLYWVHSPLAHALRIPRERVLIVAGRGDRVVPPEHPATLWRHWGEPAIHWFSGSHLAPFGRGGIVRAIDAHLRGVGVL